jgi:HPt (histidine-containing phosphotransfer) domain-containing protein
MFIESGFDDYLVKPVDSVLLEQALMRNLPERLVTIINADAAAEIPPELRAELSSLLKKYDLSLDLALKYLSGDLFQLAKVGRFFIKSSEENIAKLSRCIEAGDYAAAVNLVHSLKGSSGNIGAEELYKSAKLLEKHLREEDYEYVALALPLFVFKWKRAEAGIKELVSALEAYSASEPEPKGESGAVHDEKELWEQLLQAVRLGNQAPALKITDELAAIRGKDELIQSIRDNIMGIEFAKAEDLIKSSF